MNKQEYQKKREELDRFRKMHKHHVIYDDKADKIYSIKETIKKLEKEVDSYGNKES